MNFEKLIQTVKNKIMDLKAEEIKVKGYVGQSSVGGLLSFLTAFGVGVGLVLPVVEEILNQTYVDGITATILGLIPVLIITVIIMSVLSLIR